MLYESHKPAVSISCIGDPILDADGKVVKVARGKISFQPGEKRPVEFHQDRFEDAHPFGELNTGSRQLQKETGLTEPELNKLVEATNDYGKRQAVGFNGIWRKSDRKKKEAEERETSRISDTFKEMKPEVLRLIISQNGGEYGPHDDQEKLVELAVESHLNPSVKKAPKPPKEHKVKEPKVPNEDESKE